MTKQIQMSGNIVKNEKISFDSDSEDDYDVFVSHATEDKESFSDEFVSILQQKFNLKVWYDAVSIKWGDSIRTEIDMGLKKSKFGVVILSRSYISNLKSRNFYTHVSKSVDFSSFSAIHVYNTILYT